jgi:hypothetical protein
MYDFFKNEIDKHRENKIPINNNIIDMLDKIKNNTNNNISSWTKTIHYRKGRNIRCKKKYYKPHLYYNYIDENKICINLSVGEENHNLYITNNNVITDFNWKEININNLTDNEIYIIISNLVSDYIRKVRYF